jgi:hypothetical protein
MRFARPTPEILDYLAQNSQNRHSCPNSWRHCQSKLANSGILFGTPWLAPAILANFSALPAKSSYLTLFNAI